MIDGFSAPDADRSRPSGCLIDTAHGDRVLQTYIQVENSFLPSSQSLVQVPSHEHADDSRSNSCPNMTYATSSAAPVVQVVPFTRDQVATAKLGECEVQTEERLVLLDPINHHRPHFQKPVVIGNCD